MKVTRCKLPTLTMLSLCVEMPDQIRHKEGRSGPILNSSLVRTVACSKYEWRIDALAKRQYPYIASEVIGNVLDRTDLFTIPAKALGNLVPESLELASVRVMLLPNREQMLDLIMHVRHERVSHSLDHCLQCTAVVLCGIDFLYMFRQCLEAIVDGGVLLFVYVHDPLDTRDTLKSREESLLLNVVVDLDVLAPGLAVVEEVSDVFGFGYAGALVVNGVERSNIDIVILSHRIGCVAWLIL